MNIEEIAQGVRECTRCPLYQGRTSPVPGEGAQDSRIMFIGEAPGAEEDRIGRPFVGTSGKLLESLLATALISRGQTYISNMLRCRPPDNANPTPEQVNTCSIHLDREIESINPGLIVPLGKYSTERFFPGTVTAQVRSRAIMQGGRIVMPMFHPAAALRKGEWKQQLLEDFIKVGDFLEGRLEVEPENRLDAKPPGKGQGSPATSAMF